MKLGNVPKIPKFSPKVGGTQVYKALGERNHDFRINSEARQEKNSNSQTGNYSNPTNSILSVSNVRTRSATVNYAFNISNPCVRHDNVSHAETADSYTHPESNPPSQQMSPVPLRQMSPASPVQASAHSETELYPPSNPSPSGTELYPPETPPLASPVPPPRADEGPVSSRTRSAKAGVRSI